MAYNKAREERKWKQWKEKEEQQLRESGMSEDSIHRLREGDWDEFKSERLYQMRRAEYPAYPIWDGTDIFEPEITEIDQLLNVISNKKIFTILKAADKETLKIIILKMMGFSVSEIAGKMDFPEQTVYTRMRRLRKKLKKYLESE